MKLVRKKRNQTRASGCLILKRENIMVTNDVVKYHLCEALPAALVEMDRDLDLSRCLRAETKMRLISMSEEELWELCRVTCPPYKTFEEIYASYKRATEELKESAGEWMKDLESYENVLGGEH